MSGYSEDLTVGQTIVDQGDTLLQKPIEAQVLLKAIRTALDRSYDATALS